MGKAEIIADGVYLIGGPNISRSDDATSFIIDFNGELVMIDSGAGRSVETLEENMEGAGLDPRKVSTLILTHCHIDHIGGAPWFKESLDCRIIIHDLDAEALETGDPARTASHSYGIEFPPLRTDKRLFGELETLAFGAETLQCLHTPGHTPGSISIYLDRGGKRILFGQDIHGPFLASFGSNIEMWRESMKKLIALNADILCEGHFGIFTSKKSVRDYIERYLKQYD